MDGMVARARAGRAVENNKDIFRPDRRIAHHSK